MSAYSTLNITRGKAKQVMLERLMGEISDDELKKFMDEYLDSRLYNCRIVADDDKYNNDDAI